MRWLTDEELTKVEAFAAKSRWLWQKAPPGVVYFTGDAAERIMTELRALRAVASEADRVEHDSWCGHGGGKCDCNRSGLSEALEAWRAGRGT